MPELLAGTARFTHHMSLENDAPIARHGTVSSEKQAVSSKATRLQMGDGYNLLRSAGAEMACLNAWFSPASYNNAEYHRVARRTAGRDICWRCVLGAFSSRTGSCPVLRRLSPKPHRGSTHDCAGVGGVATRRALRRPAARLGGMSFLGFLRICAPTVGPILRWA